MIDISSDATFPLRTSFYRTSQLCSNNPEAIPKLLIAPRLFVLKFGISLLVGLGPVLFRIVRLHHGACSA